MTRLLRALLALPLLGIGFLATPAAAQPTSASCSGVTVPAFVTASRPSSPNDQYVGYNVTAGYCETYTASTKSWAPNGPSSGSSFASANVTTATGYQQYGATILSETNATLNASLWVGKGAGASLPAGSIFSTFVGFDAGQNFTGASGEATCVGTISCQFLVSGSFDTALGEHSLGSEITASNSTSIGNDNMRDYVSGGNNTSVGKSAMIAGGGTSNTSLGFEALMGSSSFLTVAGSATNLDTIALTFTGGFAGSPQSTTPITVTTSETPAQIATALNAAINANSTLTGNAALTTGTSGAVIEMVWPGTQTTGYAITVTAAVTGSATETVVQTNGPTGFDNIAIGDRAMMGQYSLSTATSDIAIGQQVLQNATTETGTVCIGGGVMCGAITSTGGTTAVGYQAAAALISGFNNSYFGIKAGTVHTGVNSTFVGAYAGLHAVGANGITAIGQSSCDAITSGANVTCVGSAVGSVTAATVQQVVLIGTNASCDTPASNTVNYIGLCAQSTPVLYITNTGTPSASQGNFAGSLEVGGGAFTTLSLANGEFGLTKITASSTAPGAGLFKLSAVAGTNVGTCKLIAFAGTSATPTTVLDNVGSGC